MDEQIKQIATEVFKDMLKKSQYTVTAVPTHMHTGVDSPLLPFNVPIFVGTPTATQVTTGNALYDYTTNKLWIFNGTSWKGVVLT